jgi:hypothetical protein
MKNKKLGSRMLLTDAHLVAIMRIAATEIKPHIDRSSKQDQCQVYQQGVIGKREKLVKCEAF